MDIHNQSLSQNGSSAQGNTSALQGNELAEMRMQGLSSKPLNDTAAAQPLTDKFQGVKVLLDSVGTKEKLLGMKKVIAMMSKGKDVEELFPYVVKNVVCPTLEVKKLVYIYLIHYAEKQQDSALLAVNHFQKDLSDKNQFIRALALRVMSSMSVSLITQIIVMAIKKCATDLSPYVRKAAALAIPKVYSLDNSLKEELLMLVSQLLKDNNTMVLGAAVFAFQEIGPEQFEIIHPHYRKLCKYLVDCDEWGQVVILGMLLRYIRDQFVSPYKEDAYKKKAFYSSDEDDWGEDKVAPNKILNPVTESLDPDFRLALDGAKPLLRARNPSVVLAVVSLYFHAAPLEEQNAIIAPLLRLIRSSRENQFVVLTNIATIAKERPELFTKHLKDFYIFDADPIFIKTLKLEILTVLANDNNIQEILREFKSYVRFSQKSFVEKTIGAVCRVATDVPEVCQPCIHILLKLLKSPSDKVVGQSIIAIRQLLQFESKDRSKIIRTIVTLIEAIKLPEAKANIIWIVGEFYDDISDMASDALRILAKNFVNEDPTVKLQTINLAAKLYMKLGDQVEKLFQYILQLAKYDQDYDIRDRGRMIRSILFNNPNLKERKEELIITEKLKVTSDSTFHERSRFAIGSLSHIVNHSVEGYEPLQDFPDTQPDTKKFRITAEELKGPDTKEINETDSTSSGRIENFYDVPGSDDERDVWVEDDDGWSSDSSYTGSSGTNSDEENREKSDSKNEENFYGSGSEYSGSESGSYTGSESGSYTGSDSDSEYSTGSESPRNSPRGKSKKESTLIDF